MIQNSDKIDRLILRYCTSDASKEEELELLNWVKISENNKRYLQRFVTLYRHTSTPSPTFDTASAYRKFKEKTSPKKRFLNPSFLRIAATVTVLLGIGLSLLLTHRPSAKELIIIAEAQTIEERLPDKSAVIVGKDSKITYPSRFTEDTREIKMEGQVHFDVKPNAKKPFHIQVGPVEVEVLGTSFDINQDTLLKTVTVTVESGKVKVSYPQKNYVVYLDPKEQCTINWSKDSFKEDYITDENYKAWRTRLLTFDASPLSKVVNDLNGLYTKKIFIADEGLLNCKLTTKIDHIPQNEVLAMLEKTLHLEVIDNGEMFILIGEGCLQ